jgi:hypothetical protein
MEIVDAEQLHTPNGLATTAQLLHDADDDGWHPAAVARLAASRLYTEWYAGIAPAPAPPDAGSEPLTWDAPSPKLSHGWHVIEVGADGGVVASRDATTLRAAPGAFLRDGGPGELSDGERLVVMTGGGSRDVQPGWIHRFGEEPGDGVATRPTTRVYFNLVEAGVPVFLRECAVLDRRRLPCHWKVSSVLARYSRRDAAVVYLPTRYLHAAVEPISEIYEALRPYLRGEVPPLTRPVAPGLAVAESPDDGKSFGVNRCRILAGVLYDHWEDPNGRSLGACVDDAFEALGLEPARPHLNSRGDPHGVDHVISLLERGLR